MHQQTVNSLTAQKDLMFAYAAKRESKQTSRL